MKYDLVNISPDDIDIPERFRQEDGDIQELSKSISERGQLQPIIIDQNNVLIDGHRRLLACKTLSRDVWATIRPSDGFVDRKVDELVSNVHRKDFTWKEECLAIDKLHQLLQQDKGMTTIGASGGWGIKNTAKMIGKSVGHISDARKLAYWIKSEPEEFSKFDKKSEAMEYIRNQEEKSKAVDILGGIEALEQILKEHKASEPLEPNNDTRDILNKKDVIITEGWIYILTNPSLQKDILKIGKTNRGPEERAKEISSPTGVATPFNVAYKLKVIDCDIVETIIGKELQRYKYSQNREFFKLPLNTAIRIVKIVSKYVEKISEEVKSIL